MSPGTPSNRSGSATLADEPIHEQPIETKSGWIIPERLKERWDLTLGKTSEKLPALLKKIAAGRYLFP